MLKIELMSGFVAALFYGRKNIAITLHYGANSSAAESFGQETSEK